MSAATARSIVITTINGRTPAIRAFEAMADWHTVIVGDRKTPEIAGSRSLIFFSLAAQESSDFETARLLPHNHYCRKNVGYLLAIQQGARTIYDTDDDNIPNDRWNVPAFLSARAMRSSAKFLNVYRYFTNEAIWPRGFPLDILREFEDGVDEVVPAVPVGVWQAMADGDPDVDAIYRLVHGRDIYFEQRPPVHLNAGVYCPFNSQATAWAERALPFLYLPCTVSFRFTDILRGYVAQRLLWQQGLHLGFMGATVRQERNPHDLMRDFSEEVEMYLNVRQVTEILDRIPLAGEPMKDLYTVYEALFEVGVVKQEELAIVSAWSRDFEGASAVSAESHG